MLKLFPRHQLLDIVGDKIPVLPILQPDRCSHRTTVYMVNVTICAVTLEARNRQRAPKGKIY